MKKGTAVILAVIALVLCSCACCCISFYAMTTSQSFRDGYCQDIENGTSTSDSDPFNWCN